MGKLLLLVLPFLAALPIAPRLKAAETEGPRTALVMGVWNYQESRIHDEALPSLPGIEADVDKMTARLKQLGFSVTTVKNPSLSQALEAVDTFGALIKAHPGVSLFYFSGHGGEFEGNNYLIPRSAKLAGPRDLSDQALSAQRVLNRMEDSGAPVNLVFLDCCRNDLTKSAVGSGLAAMHARGTFIGFATARDQSSDAEAGGSPYTRFLLDRMMTPGLSITDMHTLVTADVQQYTRAHGAERTPAQYSELNTLFSFRSGAPLPSVPTLPPPPAPTEWTPGPPGTYTFKQLVTQFSHQGKVVLSTDFARGSIRPLPPTITGLDQIIYSGGSMIYDRKRRDGSYALWPIATAPLGNFLFQTTIRYISGDFDSAPSFVVAFLDSGKSSISISGHPTRDGTRFGVGLQAMKDGAWHPGQANENPLWEIGKDFNLTVKHIDGSLQVWVDDQQAFDLDIGPYAPGIVKLGAGAVAKIGYSNLVIAKLP